MTKSNVELSAMLLILFFNLTIAKAQSLPLSDPADQPKSHEAFCWGGEAPNAPSNKMSGDYAEARIRIVVMRGKVSDVRVLNVDPPKDGRLWAQAVIKAISTMQCVDAPEEIVFEQISKLNLH